MNAKVIHSPQAEVSLRPHEAFQSALCIHPHLHMLHRASLRPASLSHWGQSWVVMESGSDTLFGRLCKWFSDQRLSTYTSLHLYRHSPNPHTLFDIGRCHPVSKGYNKFSNLLDIDDVFILLFRCLLTS